MKDDLASFCQRFSVFMEAQLQTNYYIRPNHKPNKSNNQPKRSDHGENKKDRTKGKEPERVFAPTPQKASPMQQN